MRGGLSTVRRVGETILRPWRVWTPAVRELLRYLEHVGFAGVPRTMGDGPWRARGGVAAARRSRAVPVATGLLADEGVTCARAVAARLPRGRTRLPALVASRLVRPGRPLASGLIMRHGDLTSWNSVWANDRLVGFIDWDLPSRPRVGRPRTTGLVQRPLRLPDRQRRSATAQPRAVGATATATVRRLWRGPGRRLDALARLQRDETERIARLGPLGADPWAAFLRQNFIPDIEEERAWILARREELLGRA